MKKNDLFMEARKQQIFEKHMPLLKPVIRAYLEEMIDIVEPENAHHQMLEFIKRDDYLDILGIGAEFLMVQFAVVGAMYAAKAVQDLEDEQGHIDALLHAGVLGWYTATRQRLEDAGIEYTAEAMEKLLRFNLEPLVRKVVDSAMVRLAGETITDHFDGNN